MRQWNLGRADVLFHPNKEDRAHANLVSFDHNPLELKELSLLKQVLGKLQVVPSEKLDEIPTALEGPPK